MAIIFSCWLLCVTFMSSYFERSKMEMLGDAFDKSDKLMREFHQERIGETERNLQLEILSANTGVDVYIFDLINYVDRINIDFAYPDVAAINTVQLSDFKSRVSEYVVGQKTNMSKHQDVQEMYENDEYSIYKVYDERIGSLYLDLFGVSDSGSYIYIRANYQSMQEGVALFNRFLGYIGLMVGVLGILVTILFTKSFVRPILDLADIAQKMSNLDLGVRYKDVERMDEIGILGNSFNQMAGKLEETISELKRANNQLKRDIEHKIQMDELRKEFLSNVSHELKTPIALIQGYAEGLSENINDDVESREFYCEVIIDEAAKMNQIVKKILSLNQIESGAEQLEFARFNLVEVIRSVLQSATILAEQKNARICFEQYHDVFVWADEFFVEEVVTNYVSNAIHHVDDHQDEDGIIEVVIEENDSTVRVRVFNTGSHIPEDELDKVWQKFYKVDKARTREYGGSGIGLSIVKAIMDAMNQNYGVKNHHNGVEFWFELDKAVSAPQN